MRLSLDDSRQRFVIRGFTDTLVKINQQELTRSFLMTPEQIIEPFPVHNVSDLTPILLDELKTDDPEVLIIGTGPRTYRGSAEFQAHLLHAKIGVEFMDTGAACRTFTVLASELRRVSLLVLFPAQPNQ